ncbi:iodothyronine deiodinase-domain-containing protein [Rhizophagus clarus]|uniref:Iodothyronine deiodinase-domain-containing protein n=1 Tax=Rhizophagus clarus TaxID=94130 RepID=A0A8H3LCI1_9GLOM|nr:iodothyronine deiodinase-domain-containing protein [Rhizophagus clarus]
MSKLFHDEHLNFSEILDPENQNDFPKDIPVNPVTILPMLPTKKEEMLTLRRRRTKVFTRNTTTILQEDPKLYVKRSDDPAFRITQVYVRNNIASLENLEGMSAPDCLLVPIKDDKTIVISDFFLAACQVV